MGWFLKHKVASAILALLVLVTIGGVAGGSKSKNVNSSSATTQATTAGSAATTTTAPATTMTVPATTTTAPATTTTAPATTTTAPATTTTVPAVSLQEQNAIQAAQQYLSLGSGFSQAGLITQLSSSYGDGYPLAVATAAVDSLNVDWNAQAVLAAKAYLQTSSFSCSGLEQQLDSSYGSQFTAAQATYAATQVGLC